MIGLVKNGAACPVTDYRTAVLNLYVNPSGNDANDGLTPGTAFKTIQKAANAAASPARAYNLTGARINLAAGTYAGNVFFSGLLGSLASLSVVGAGKANTIIRGYFWFGGWSGRWDQNSVSDLTINTDVNLAVNAYGGATVVLRRVACNHVGEAAGGSGMICAEHGASMRIFEDVAVRGSSAGDVLLLATHCANLELMASSVTLEGLGAFAAEAMNGGALIANAAETTILSPGGFTGRRYNAYNGGQIHTRGGGPNFFPGTIAGATATAGVYD